MHLQKILLNMLDKNTIQNFNCHAIHKFLTFFYTGKSKNTYADVGTFFRSKPAGYVDIVINQTQVHVDTISPSKVRNLRTSKLFDHNSSVCLTWTAVGDDYSSGQGEYLSKIFLKVSEFH